MNNPKSITQQTRGPYSSEYYSNQGPGSRSSAEIVLPLLMDTLDLKSLIDVGCGKGTWVAAAASLDTNLELLGVDGNWVKATELECHPDHFQTIDLNAPTPIGRRFDLAISLEVVEHLLPESADGLVRFLCGCSDAIFFGAAVPGQGGTDHFNEERQSSWESRFKHHGYRAVDLIRPRVWNHPEVEV